MERTPYRSAQRASGPDPEARYLPQLRPVLLSLALAAGAFGATRAPPPLRSATVLTCSDRLMSSPVLVFPPPSVRPRECSCRVPSHLEAAGRPRPTVREVPCAEAGDAVLALGRTVPPGAALRVETLGSEDDVEGVALRARTCTTGRCRLTATFHVAVPVGGVGFERGAWLAVALVLALLSIPTRRLTLRVDRPTGTVHAVERALVGRSRGTEVALTDVVDAVDDDAGIALLLRDGRRLVLTTTDWRPTALRARSLERVRDVLASARTAERG